MSGQNEQAGPGAGRADTPAEAGGTQQAAEAARAGELDRELPADVVRQGQAIAAEGARELIGGAAAGLESNIPGQAPEADITPELDEGAVAFGKLIEAVGMSVAKAQAELDATFRATVEALSKQKIDVIAVYEQVLDENGGLKEGNPIVLPLPAINFIPATSLRWTEVRLEADMEVKEFNKNTGFDIKSRSSSLSASANASYGLGGFGASGGVRYGSNSSEVAAGTSLSEDTAAGKLHLEAVIEPRPDIPLPRPLVVQKGPRLTLTAGPWRPIPENPTDPKSRAIGREATITAELVSIDNKKLAGKPLDVRSSLPQLAVESSNGGQTDTDGRMQVTVRRQGALFDETKAPEAVTVTVSLGFVVSQAEVFV